MLAQLHEWKPADDVKLVNYFRKFGPDWTRISCKFKNRSAKDVEEHYDELMDKVR
jgi:hypothetical protein